MEAFRNLQVEAEESLENGNIDHEVTSFGSDSFAKKQRALFSTGVVTELFFELCAGSRRKRSCRE